MKLKVVKLQQVHSEKYLRRFLSLSFILLVLPLFQVQAAEPATSTIQPSEKVNSETQNSEKYKAINKIKNENLEPIWEYGVGLGFVRFEQYPAAGKYSQLFIPFPTFQYRGRIVRADDREGAKAYLWKHDSWTVEIAGTGTPPLDSDDNEFRKGMKDLPWILAVGPELVYKFNRDFDFGLGVFQAITTNFQDTRLAGGFFEGIFTYTSEDVRSRKFKTLTKYFLTFKSATAEIQDQYFGVRIRDVTSLRPQFHARAGFLSVEASVFKSFKLGRTAVYVGANYADYSFAENKKSPLYRSSYQLNYLFGVTYVLGESTRPEVDKEDTSGIINQKLGY